MIKRQFMSNDNVDLLWNVLSDSGLLSSLNNQELAALRNQMIEVVRRESINDVLDLTKANKYVLSFLYKWIQENKSIQGLRRPEDVSASAIAESRRAEFDSELERRRFEFEESVSMKVPEPPDFKDAPEDDSLPIDTLLARIQEERETLTN